MQTVGGLIKGHRATLCTCLAVCPLHTANKRKGVMVELEKDSTSKATRANTRNVYATPLATLDAIRRLNDGK